MSTTSLLTRETAGVFATVKDFPLTNEEVDTNWLTLAENKLEKSFNLSDLTDVVEARINLGLGGIESMAIQSDDDVSITGGSISGVDLQFTARTLWGQSFDGSNNVNGNIVGAGTIQFGTQSSKATLTYTTNTVRTLTVPALSGNRTFAFINESQTFSGTQTFSSTISGSINGNAATANNLNRQVIAGDGLSGGGTLNSDITVSVDATVVRTSRNLTAGDGLSGGGNLSANRSFAVDATVIRTTGNQTLGGVKTFSSNVQISSLGVGTTASGTAGQIRATNDITAFFSDDRLKIRLGNIENAIEKIETLSAFYYEPNETAQDLGYVKQRYVGLSAQEVEKILPEVIKPAPVDDKYLTIQYEKLVPLLIAAIQELKKEINNLKRV